MLLKRLYDTPAEGGAARLAGVAVIHTGTHEGQNFAPRYVERAVSEGWMSLSRGTLTIHAAGADLVYKIVRGPGRWCCHCGEKLPDDDHPKGELARQHVAEKHAGKKSPDPSNPAGYVLVSGEQCTGDAATHKKYKAKPGEPWTVHHVADELRRKRRESRQAAASKATAAVLIALGILLLLVGIPPDFYGLLATNFVFNIAKGRAAELYNRVDTNDPANSALLVIPLETAGIETQANLEDSDTFTEVVDGTTNEATTGNWARKTITDADIAAFAPDDTNNRVDLVIADQTWTAVTGNAVSALIVGYDNDTTGGTDANVIPLTHHDFTVTPDGSDITADVPATGFFRAT